MLLHSFLSLDIFVAFSILRIPNYSKHGKNLLLLSIPEHLLFLTLLHSIVHNEPHNARTDFLVGDYEKSVPSSQSAYSRKAHTITCAEGDGGPAVSVRLSCFTDVFTAERHHKTPIRNLFPVLSANLKYFDARFAHTPSSYVIALQLFLALLSAVNR